MRLPARRLAWRAGRFIDRTVIAALALCAPVCAFGFGELTDVTAIAAGSDHVCALTAATGVKCWGENSDGQLGDGTTASRRVPVDVAGLAQGVSQVVAGAARSCALMRSGGVKCWGANGPGWLGSGSTAIRESKPVDVIGLASGVASLAAGGSHSCALTTAGGVKCWGENRDGQLGDGTTTTRTTPVDVVGLQSGVVAIAAGAAHTCAITARGAVKCWGAGYSGQLGNGSNQGSPLPVDVIGFSQGALRIAAGNQHTCAAIAAGGVRCWGANYAGQLGDGTTNASFTPVSVAGLVGVVTALAAGDLHTCAIESSGRASCWGQNKFGQLGNGTLAYSGTLSAVEGLSSAPVAITGGSFHTCALTDRGGVECWGNNDSGQLGDGSATASTTPRTTAVEVVGLANAVKGISVGGNACALDGGGGVSCWGANGLGGIGDGTTRLRARPTTAIGLASGIAKIATGGDHACALGAGGAVKCWGANYAGQLGDGTTQDRSVPVSVIGLAGGVTDITAGGGHSCALMAGGSLKCWGWNTRGQLGDGSTTGRSVPVDVAGLPGAVRAVSAGAQHTCALLLSGSVYCWGENDSSQLGNTPVNFSASPVAIPSLASTIALSAGGNHTCALTASREVMCWGSNWAGQLGDGSIDNRPVPARVTGLPGGIAAISAGGQHTCALGSAGIHCWGYNYYGQLGDDTRENRLVPVRALSIGPGALAVSAGGSGTCAIVAGGRAKCWGANDSGGVGDGTSGYRPLPSPVLANWPSARHTGLWWNPDESGWGINFNHQGGVLFATLFTYDRSGSPLWLAMTNGRRRSAQDPSHEDEDVFDGILYRMTGSAFDAQPFVPLGAANVTSVGGMSVTFKGNTSARLAYNYEQVLVTKVIEREAYGARVPECVPATGSRASLANYQDLWWNPTESGWGVNITHQDDILFATLFTYDRTKRGTWFVMSEGRRQPDGSFEGALYRTRGSAFDSVPVVPLSPSDVSQVGSMRFRFADGENGVMDYTVDGAAVTKAITRQVFESPVPACAY